jgi:DNA-binding response OmpR family regulator
MQNHVKYLVVDDVPEWAEAIGNTVRGYFENRCDFAKSRIRDYSAFDPKQADQLISDGGWDLVTLDMNLGEAAAKSKISGLDLLGEIAAGKKAYFVIIVTGAVNDPTLEKVYGKETAALLRFGALNEAVKQMPASRVRILHKPEGLEPGEAMKTLRPHLESALDQYCSVSRERNIFRPLPGDPGLWEVCYNGGSRITLAHIEAFKLIRSALAQPNRALKVIQLIQALADSSGKTATILPSENKAVAHRKGARDMEYRGHQSDDVSGADGLDWSEMDGFSTSGHSPVDTNEGAIGMETLLGGLLLAQSKRLDLRVVLSNYADSFGENTLLALPSVAARWAKRGDAADQEFGMEEAPAKLMRMAEQLKPLLLPIREKWEKERKENLATGANSSKKPSKKKIRVARGVDTAELGLARAHWKRFKASIARRPALGEFHEHMIQWVDRSPTAKGHFHYRSPDGSHLCPFWLTE